MLKTLKGFKHLPTFVAALSLLDRVMSNMFHLRESAARILTLCAKFDARARTRSRMRVSECVCIMHCYAMIIRTQKRRNVKWDVGACRKWSGLLCRRNRFDNQLCVHSTSTVNVEDSQGYTPRFFHGKPGNGPMKIFMIPWEKRLPGYSIRSLAMWHIIKLRRRCAPTA